MLRYSLTATLLMIAVMFGWGEAYLSEILCSNVNQVELLAIAVLAWFELRPDGARRDYLCGGGMALIVLFKPNLVAVAGLLALMWVVDRRFAALRRHAIGFALATIVIVTLTSIQFGSLRCWGQWLAAAGDLPQLVAKEGKQVYSLQSVTMTRWDIPGAWRFSTPRQSLRFSRSRCRDFARMSRHRTNRSVAFARCSSWPWDAPCR